MSAERGLRLEEVTISVGGRTLLHLDCLVPPGETLTVMGPSGSGKSSLFALIAGFLEADFKSSGSIRLNGRELTGLAPEQRRVGLLFQDALLYPHMNVGQNLLFGLSAAVRGRDARREAVEAMLREVGLAGYFTRNPSTLSGGQQARIALARTLLARPEALLLDEPFARLDTELRDSMRALVFSQVAARSIPALLVSHDPGDAVAAGGPVIEIGTKRV